MNEYTNSVFTRTELYMSICTSLKNKANTKLQFITVNFVNSPPLQSFWTYVAKYSSVP